MAEKIVTEYEVVTQKSIENLQAVSNKLKETDANIAKTSASSTAALNKTSVAAGTTAKSFNGLSNSISQVSRELPNFALNAQTGFLAISNNLPILFDNLQQVREENARLAASGQKTTSVFKQVLSSVFSLNTALTLVIALTIIYGKELGNFFSQLFKGKEAISEAKLRLDALNAAYDSKELKSGVKSLIDLSAKVQLAKDGYIESDKVIKQYNETLGFAFGNVNSLKAAEQGIIDNTAAYVNAIVSREAANKIAADAANTLIKLRQTQLKDEKEFITTGVILAATQVKDVKDNAKLLEEIRKEEKATRERLAKEAKEAEVKQLQEQFDTQIGLIVGFQKDAGKFNDAEKGNKALKDAFSQLNAEISKTESLIKSNILKGIDTTDSVAKLQKLKDELEAVEINFQRLQSLQDLPTAPDITQTLNPIDPQAIEQNVDLAVKEVGRLNKKVFENAKDSIKENQEVGKSFAEIEREKTEVFEEEERRRSQIREQLTSGVISIASTFEQELSNLRRSNLVAETEMQIQALEQQKEFKIITESQFEEKRRQLLNEQAQAQRQLDLSQIKINTALAIIKTLAVFGLTPKGAIAASIAAVEGGIQYAFAAAQPLPRFAKGTDRVKGGVKGQDSVLSLLMPDEAVIPAKRNLERPEMAKAWINGDLDRYLTMNYIRPALEANNKAWEKQINVNQSSQFIRNDNFNDKRIVKGLDSINRKLGRKEEKVVYKRNRRLWN